MPLFYILFWYKNSKEKKKVAIYKYLNISNKIDHIDNVYFELITKYPEINTFLSNYDMITSDKC